MRELGVVASKESLDLGFPEIASTAEQCRFVDCAHAAEPGCAVREAVDAGDIDPPRWESYLKLKREVRHNLIVADTSAQLAEKQRWKAIHKANKRMYREREKR